MKNAFYFILKGLFVLKMFKFLCVDALAMQKKRLDLKDKVNFKIDYVTAWLTKNYSTHIAQYLPK